MKMHAGICLCCKLFLGLVISSWSIPEARSADADSPAETVKAPESAAPDISSVTNGATESRITQATIEQLRREIEQSAVRNAEAITASLSVIEPTLRQMQERQMEAVQRSNRTILIVAGIFAAVGFLGLIFISLILVRALGRFSELAVMAAPRGHLLGQGQSLGVLGPGDIPSSGSSAAELASQRFQGAIDQLQGRIRELEHSVQSATETAFSPSRPTIAATPRPVPEAASALNIQPLLPGPQSPPGGQAENAAPASRATVLLGKGQALLNLDATEQALQCFDEVLAAEPNHAEALVKRGMALEKLQDWEQALESYDRAIAIDGSLTVAHLYRGGVCNRLQRHREALESYEKALRSEKKVRAS
jgi:tetratricopeptide (TPR) repeat protein